MPFAHVALIGPSNFAFSTPTFAFKGTVAEVNKALEGNPALINTDPFGEGWIFVLKMDAPEQVKQLKDAAGYRAAIG